MTGLRIPLIILLGACKVSPRRFTRTRIAIMSPKTVSRLSSRVQTSAVLIGFLAIAAEAAEFKFPGHTITVPDGFEVELAAGPELAPRPIYGAFDEQGRLYVADSSGASGKAEQQLADPQHRILCLEDTDGDGKFDKQTVFADKMMFPEGCLWYDGSVYVGAPPSIWKLTDTNSDGVADVRVEWHQGKTITGCANDLHGPYLGMDGMIYWTKGAFAEQTYEVNGKPFKSRASHIFRSRPDRSGIEPVLTGGMDNPVGLAWTPEGELIMCGTFFVVGQSGKRDGMIHSIYGGVYGKANAVLDEHKKTGDLMPIMTHMGPAAPASVRRYESSAFGGEYRNNMFCAQFNLHKVSRHVLTPDGATYRTSDSDFLVSDNPDFHPTDVVEDADGSLLVLDTGAWYKICCPTSQLAKPDVVGTIYRVRRKGAPKIEDARGLKVDWRSLDSYDLRRLLADRRLFVRERAIEELARRKDAVEAICAVNKIGVGYSDAQTLRQNQIRVLTRIDSPEAREQVRVGLSDRDESIRILAVQSVGLWRDRSARERLTEILTGSSNPQLQRAAAEALGRIGDARAVMRLIERAGKTVDDRVLEHSITYALIEIGKAGGLAQFLNSTNSRIQRAALVALDQMNESDLKPEQILPLLKSPSPDLRKTTVWVASRHPEWGGALAGFFREHILASDFSDDDRAEFQAQLAQFVGNDAVQQVIVETLKEPSASLAARQMLLRVMAAPGLKEAPKGWADAVRVALDDKDEKIVRSAIGAARALALVKSNAPNFAERLQKIARDTSRPDDLRLDALAALPRGLRSVEPDLFGFLSANVNPAKSVAMRSAASGVLAKANLNDDQLLSLADTLKSTSSMEVSRLLGAFDHGTNEAVGLQLVAALKESKGLSGVRPEALRTIATNYPPSVQQKADELLASVNEDAAKQGAHLNELLAAWPKGDIRRGQVVFNSTKAACSSCHRMGSLGGTVGPDLTSIGTVRTERDLLESILYPSASFVRSYEPLIVATKSDDDYSGVLRKDAANEIVLATGPNTEMHIARSDITEMRPGTVSVMPGGLDQLLTKQELADLVTFLKNTRWGN